jgi:signal transduction histidine kinase/Flp pilus assembly protein TadD
MINEISDVIKNLRLHIGKESFIEVFLSSLYKIFEPNEIYFFSIIESKIEGVKFSDYKIEKVDFNLEEISFYFNIDIEYLKNRNYGIIEDLSYGNAQKVFIFKIEDITYLLILKNIKKLEIFRYLKLFQEILGFIVYSYYYIQKQQKRDSDFFLESLATFAHEIKHPLSIIKTSLELIKIPEIDEKEREKIIEIANAAIIELTEEIDNLIIQPTQKKEFEKFSLNELLQEIIKEVEPLALVKDIKISYDIDKIIIIGSRNNLKKALLNIFINAIKYNKREGKVYIQAKKINNIIQIKIKDTGIGIPKELHQKIFEKYFRGEHPGIKGTGLGLYIAKKIIEQHQGTIEVESTPGEGSEFIITLYQDQKPLKSYFLLFSLIIFSFFVMLNIFPIIPYRPNKFQGNQFIVYHTISDSIIRTKRETNFECEFRKTLLFKKERINCKIWKGELEGELKNVNFELDTPRIKLKNVGTNFSLFTENEITGLSVYEGMLKGKGYQFNAGIGAIIEKGVKTLPLLSAVKNVDYKNLLSGELEIYWEDVSGAKEYEVVIAKDEKFINVLNLLRTFEPKVVIKIETDGFYYIKIQAIDENKLKGSPYTSKIKNLNHLTRGIFYRQIGNFYEALREFERSNQDFEGKEVLPLSEIAWTYYLKGDYYKAIEKYKEALKISRLEKDLVRLARTYYHLNNLEEAKKLYKEVLEKNKSNLDALWGLADIYIKEKNISKALEYLYQVKQIDNTYPLLHYSLAKVYILNGDIYRAISELKIELKFHPDTKEAKELLSKIKK